MKTGLAVFLALLLAVAATAAIFAWRWNATTADAFTRLTTASAAWSPRVDSSAMADLPPAVARYLKAVLGSSRGTITRARIGSNGTFLLKADPEQWGPFTATQVFTTEPPGFVWDARIHMMPGIAAYVRDMFLDGAGSMHGAAFGAITVVHPPPSPELDAGSLQRYLAEGIWFPTLFLPGCGVTWTALTDSSARATITAGRTTVALDFFFGPDGLATRVFTAGRYADQPGGAVLKPWEVRLRRYDNRDGVMIPVEAEVGWISDGKWQPYWRGLLTAVEYTWAGR